MDDLIKAQKYYFLGIFSYLALIQVAGFLSPFYARLMYPEDIAAHTLYFLEIFQDILPWFSILYLVGAFYLVRVQSIVGKIFTWFISAMAVFVNLVYIVATDDADLREALYSISGVFEPILMSIVLFVSYRYLSTKIEREVE